MALAYLQSLGPTRIVVTIRDYGRKSVSKTFVVPASVWDPASGLWADLVTIRNNLITALDAIIDGLIYRVNVIIGEQEDTAVIPAGVCLVTDIASITLNCETLGKTAVYSLPTPNDGIMKGTSGKDRNIVDVADVNLNLFFDLFQTTGGTFVLSDGEFLDDTAPMDAGKRISRGSNSQV